MLKKISHCSGKEFFTVILVFLRIGVCIVSKSEGKFVVKSSVIASRDTTKPGSHGKYALVNGLRMYYEDHGNGQPVILLHGGISTIDKDYSKIIPVLSKNHRVIAIELQGHGHTADIDRALRYEYLADDVNSLLAQLKIAKADFCGYSLGGGVILQLAIAHPEVVKNMILISTAYSPEGYNPGVPIDSLKKKPLPDASIWKDAYLKVASDTSKWGTLIKKVFETEENWKGWQADQIKAFNGKVLLIFGDADLSTPQHAAQMFALFGGGPSGDFYELPGSQLAILPGTTHTQMMERTELLIPIIAKFLKE